MNEKHLEHVSSLLDNELHSEEADHVIQELTSNENSGKKLDRYALIGCALRDKEIVVEGESFLTKIQHAVAGEPVVFAPKQVMTKSNKPYASIALAASFSFLAVILFNTFPSTKSEPGIQPYAANIQKVEQNLAFDNQKKNVELENYLRQHKGLNPKQSRIPNTRLVGFGK